MKVRGIIVKIKKLSLGQLGTNSYLLENAHELLIIDPAGEPQRLMAEIDVLEKQPVAILLTHAHFDHIGALDQVRSRYGVPVYLHESEHDWLSNPALNGSKYFPVEEVICQPADRVLKAGPLKIGSFNFDVIETPGHSPGGVAFIFADIKTAVSGDSLFKSGIGRTDLPLGDYDTLITSIKEKLYNLPDAYSIYPGHGPETTIKEEKMSNPFV